MGYRLHQREVLANGHVPSPGLACPSWRPLVQTCAQARTSHQPSAQEPPRFLTNQDTYARRTPRPAVEVTQIVPTRPRPLEPEPVPIIHSSAYQQTLVQNRMSPMGSMDDDAQGPQAASSGTTRTTIVRRKRNQMLNSAEEETFDGSAIEWALRKADASLDELEANPLPLQRAMYGISRGPVGQATTNAVQAAAKLTMQATVEAAKVAAPFGRWALAEGAKAAASLLKAAVVEGVKLEGRRNAKKGKGDAGERGSGSKQSRS